MHDSCKKQMATYLGLQNLTFVANFLAEMFKVRLVWGAESYKIIITIFWEVVKPF